MPAHLAAAATAAEELRQRYGRDALDVGCELTVFGSGTIPGDTYADRSAKPADPRWWPRFPSAASTPAPATDLAAIPGSEGPAPPVPGRPVLPGRLPERFGRPRRRRR